MSEPTHILRIFPSQQTEMLFRADDGVALGQRKNETVIFGIEPNKRGSRVFMNAEFARKWLKAYAQTDLKDRGLDTVAVVQEDDAEGMIVLPPDSIGFPANGAINPLPASLSRKN